MPDAMTFNNQRLLRLASGSIRCNSELLECFEELRGLTEKESVGGEAFDRCDGATKFIGYRTNDCTVREIGADEFARDRKDQVRLNQGGRKQRRFVEKIRKGETPVRHRRDRRLYSVTCEIDPLEKVSDLVSADTEGDLKHLRMFNFLTHGCVKTGTPLFNVSEVKGCYIRDHLNVIGILEISIGDGNGGPVIDIDSLRKRGAKVWIGCTAVANEPAGVYVEVHKVREASDAC
jgi:hypothetical protein